MTKTCTRCGDDAMYKPPEYYTYAADVADWVKELSGLDIDDLEGIDEYDMYEDWQTGASCRLVALELLRLSGHTEE